MKTLMFSLSVKAMISGAALFGLTAQASVRTLQWNGSGCPKAEETDRGDGTMVVKRELGDTFQIKRGPGVRIVENRKQCSLIVSSMEGKEQFALEKIEIDGKGPPGFGVNDELQVDVSVQGQSQAKTFVFNEGKASGDEVAFKKVKAIAESDLQWSPCDRSLTLNSKAKLDGKTNAGAPVNASIDSIIYTFRTKPCVK